VSPRARVAAVAGGLVLVVGVAAVAALGVGGGGDGTAAAPDRTGPATTVTVTRQTLVDTITVVGTVNFGGALPLTSAATGTLTWLPDVGTIVARGETVFRVDDEPVVLLYGTLPMYRDLTEGLRGNDIRQLETNLAELGFSLSVDDLYSAETARVVREWQRRLGRTPTGVVAKTDVVYASGPIRVAQRLLRPGATATGDVLSYTGTTRVITATATTAEVGWATAGTAVTVVLPGGQSVAGRVSSAVPVQAAGEGPPGLAATVMVTVAVEDQAALGESADGAPVQVRHVAAERADVLVVPVAALLALAEGGYGLEVVEPSGVRIVPVQVGLFADGKVEVNGPGIEVGTRVGMPS
jgi:peptidoglycan hydrolase-like protein with peptidoglycan-binding domain